MKRIVLAGLGHTHALLLASIAHRHWAETEVVCVNPAATVWYTGMLPGVLAGQYQEHEATFDGAALCARAGATLIVGDVVHLDPPKRMVRTSRGETLHYDLLSLNFGSGPPGIATGPGRPPVVSVRPLATFVDRLRSTWKQVTATVPAASALRLGIAGGGLGGVELACTAGRFLKSVTPTRRVETRLFSRSRIGAGVSPATHRRLTSALDRSGVEVRLGHEAGRLSLTDADLVILATGAVPPAGLHGCGLDMDPAGFVRINHALQTSEPDVFAVGDTATLAHHCGERVAKAGVYAVRQAPVLAANLRAALAGAPLHTFVPQRSFLRLINTGDGHAVGEWHGVSFEGRWAFWLKDRIDRRFMRRFPPGLANPTIEGRR